MECGDLSPLSFAAERLRKPRKEERKIGERKDVTERNSVIEGLPPFAEETRRQLCEKLSAMSGRQPLPRGLSPRPPRRSPAPCFTTRFSGIIMGGVGGNEVPIGSYRFDFPCLVNPAQ